jgi:glucose uptake protein
MSVYSPGSFSTALILTVSSTVFWGSWANTYKGTKSYPFELFYWDYILGVVICSLVFAFTLGSFGSGGEPFVENLHNADSANVVQALVAGVIFNVANLLLVAAVDIAGLAVAFPISIGIAVVEGVVLSYALQPKGDVRYLAGGVALALIAVIFDARAYRSLSVTRADSGVVLVTAVAADSAQRKETAQKTQKKPVSLGMSVSVISGLLMGGFAPFVTRAMTHGHALTPYSVAALFSIGALLCCFVVNVHFMKRPLRGTPVSFSGFWQAGWRNHLLGGVGGLAWGMGGCLNFIAAGFVGVPISYAIGQSAPLIAAAWGVLVWREFRGARTSAWIALSWMFACYIAAISLIALAYNN